VISFSHAERSYNVRIRCVHTKIEHHHSYLVEYAFQFTQRSFYEDTTLLS